MDAEAEVVAVANTIEISQLASEIQSRISALEALFEDSLVNEMDSLKICLVENPSAAALLKDEDVGLLVKALMRTVNVAVAEAIAGKEKKPRKDVKKQFSQAEMDAALAAEGL
jgi:hypothetical protein